LPQSGPCIFYCCSSIYTLYNTGWPEFVQDWYKCLVLRINMANEH
jgi:hypothetical protein